MTKPIKQCTQEGCDRPHRARGLCGSHYNQAHQADRHAKKPTPCAYCGAEVLKHASQGSRRAVCSYNCRSNLARKDDIQSRSTRTDIVGPVKATRVRPYPTWKQELPSINRTFINGRCEWCGDAFTAVVRGNSTPPLCCSAVCAKRRQWAKWGQTSNWIVPRRRYAIYERDNWTCQLCAGPVDKTLHYSDNWAASLDHIIPRSRQLVPDHSDSNLRLAHRWCNAVLGDGSYYTEHDLAA